MNICYESIDPLELTLLPQSVGFLGLVRAKFELFDV